MFPSKRIVTAESLPVHKRAVQILSPITGKVIPLDEVPHPLFSQLIFGDGVAILPSGYQIIAPFSGTVISFPELANQIRLKSSIGLQLQIQLGIDSHIMMAEGFKRKVKEGDSFHQGQVLGEFTPHKMKKQLPSTLCPITLINSDKVKGIEPHYYQVVGGEDKMMTVYI